jgi:hypothetical protein
MKEEDARTKTRKRPAAAIRAPARHRAGYVSKALKSCKDGIVDSGLIPYPGPRQQFSFAACR